MVPGKSHYAARYVKGGRLFSYAHQVNVAVDREARSVLEIGPGPGMVTASLRAIGVEVTTVDIQQELDPDVVASVTSLPFADNSFDMSMCCQVLEHLPFDQLVPALMELSRVAKTTVLVSLPDPRPRYDLCFKVPGVKRVEIAFSRSKRVPEERIQRSWETSGHYWEIGYPKYGLSRVVSAFEQAGLVVTRHWRPVNMKYHHFFECAVRPVQLETP